MNQLQAGMSCGMKNTKTTFYDSVQHASFLLCFKRNGDSINSTDVTELQQATQDLIEQKPLVQAYVVTVSVMQD